MLSTVDVYGDGDELPDAQWNSIWTKWDHWQRDKYFASVVHWGPLGIGQCEQLIQGFPPSPAGWSRPTSCLAQYGELVARLREDVARGHISSSPTAEELAGWCDAMNASLPEALVRALLTPATAPGCAAPQTVTTVSLPAWVPALPQPPSAQPLKRKRGRPKAAAGTIAAITERARSMLMEAARLGKTTTQLQLVRNLKAEGLGSAMSDENMLSRLKHAKLPTKEAAATAVIARSRKLAKSKGKFVQG